MLKVCFYRSIYSEDKEVRLYHFTSAADSLPGGNTDVFMSVLRIRQSINSASVRFLVLGLVIRK